MKRILLVVLLVVGLGGAVPCLAQTVTNTPSHTNTPTASNTPTRTATFTPSITLTPTLTRTPSNTATVTRTPTNTLTPTTTRTPTAFPPGAGTAMGVPSGAAISAWMALNPAFVYTVMVYAPTTLAETATFEVSDSDDAAVVNTLSTGAADYTVAAAKAVSVTNVVAARFRIKLNGNAAAARAFRVRAVATTRASN